MGKYSVPEELRKLKPKGTMAKAINGGYYVYEYKEVKRPDGKYKTEMGDCIGKLVPGIGFVPNGVRMNEMITVVDYGQYALAASLSKDVLSLLKKIFGEEEAVGIYAVALIHFVGGYTPMKNVSAWFSQSVLSVMYPGLKVGEDEVSKLYEDLGRREQQITAFQNNLIEGSSKKMALERHAIWPRDDGCGSIQGGNDFAGGGGRMNIVMMRDIAGGAPLAAGMLPGESPDEAGVRDFLAKYDFHDAILIADEKDFPSKGENLFKGHGNSYVISLGNGSITPEIKDESEDVSGMFLCKVGKERHKIDFKEWTSDGERILCYRDADEVLEAEKNFMSHARREDELSACEEYDGEGTLWGVTELKTNLTLSAEEIYLLYMKRESGEAYRCFNGGVELKALGGESDCMARGLTFVMQVSSLVESVVEMAVKEKTGMSLKDCLLDAKTLKAVYAEDEWKVCNMQPKTVRMFEMMGVSLTLAGLMSEL